MDIKKLATKDLNYVPSKKTTQKKDKSLAYKKNNDELTTIFNDIWASGTVPTADKLIMMTGWTIEDLHKNITNKDTKYKFTLWSAIQVARLEPKMTNEMSEKVFQNKTNQQVHNKNQYEAPIWLKE